MDMMSVWHGAAMGQPHPVTLSGGLAHFQTDMTGLMQITGSGNITVCGKNLFGLWANGYWNGTTMQWASSSAGAVCKPIRVSAGTVITLSQTNASATYQFHEWSKYVSNPWDYKLADNLVFARSDKGQGKTYTVQNDCYLTIFANINTDTVDTRKVQAEVGESASAFAPYTGTTATAGTARKSLVGINNVWSDDGDVVVTYWTH